MLSLGAGGGCTGSSGLYEVVPPTIESRVVPVVWSGLQCLLWALQKPVNRSRCGVRFAWGVPMAGTAQPGCQGLFYPPRGDSKAVLQAMLKFDRLIRRVVSARSTLLAPTGPKG